MAQERPATPEKQLLKLIEDPKTGDLKTVESHAIKHRSLSLLSFSAWVGRFSFSKDRLKKWIDTREFRKLDIKAINKILGLCVFILIVYFISNLSISIMSFNKTPDFKLEVKKALVPVGIQENSVLKKSVSYYLDKVRGRDVFNIKMEKVADPTEEEDVVVTKAPTSRIIEATQSLKLVGISWSDDPDAMIEDSQALNTFFVKRGEMIGDIKVEAIFKDKVLLSYEGEEIELQ